MKQFTTAARRGTSPVPNPIDIKFQWDDYELTAHPPTSGQLALFIAQQANGVTLSTVNSMFELLEQILGEDDYAIIYNALQDGVDIQLIFEVIEYLVGEWSARPTTPSAASSRSRTSGGPRSTVKPRPTASTSGVSLGTPG